MPNSTVSLTLPELGNPLLEKTVVGLMGFSENFQLGLFQLIGTPPKSQSHLLRHKWKLILHFLAASSQPPW